MQLETLKLFKSQRRYRSRSGESPKIFRIRRMPERYFFVATVEKYFTKGWKALARSRANKMYVSKRLIWLRSSFWSFRMIGQSGWSSMEELVSAANQAEQIVYTKWTKAAGAVLMLSLLPQQCCSVWFQLGEYHVRCWTCLSCEIPQPRKSGNISAKKLMAGPDTASVESPSAQFVAAPLSFTCQQVWDRTKRRAHLGKSIGQGPSSHGNRLMQPFSDNTRGCFHSYACVTGSCQKQKGFPQ